MHQPMSGFSPKADTSETQNHEMLRFFFRCNGALGELKRTRPLSRIPRGRVAMPASPY